MARAPQADTFQRQCCRNFRSSYLAGTNCLNRPLREPQSQCILQVTFERGEQLGPAGELGILGLDAAGCQGKRNDQYE